MEERLQKKLASAGIASRRKSEELIAKGKVKVNGKIITELGFKVSDNDVIMVDNKKIETEKKVYYMLNKPRGVISSVSDDKGRNTVVQLINTKLRIFPIGRLDYDTTGLLLLTNDGDFANKLMHPSYKVAKTYVVKIKGLFDMEKYHALKNGIIIDDIKVKPTRLKIKKYNKETDTSMIEITIIEGRNHIVKRIFEYFHIDVLKLKREQYGRLTLGNLQSGEYRELTEMEINSFLS